MALTADTLYIPAASCAELEQSATHLQRTIMEWPLTLAALPLTRGFCWFEKPVLLHSRNESQASELTALTWVYGRMDPDEPRVAYAPDGILFLSGLVKSPWRENGVPDISCEWPMNFSYIEATLHSMKNVGQEAYEKDGRDQSLQRLFASLFERIQGKSWNVERKRVPVDQWSALSRRQATLANGFGQQKEWELFMKNISKDILLVGPPD